MGSPVSSVIADIFMADFEETALNNYACPPHIWLRFVDDVLSVIQANQKATFLEHLNAQNKSVQFFLHGELDALVLGVQVFQESSFWVRLDD